MPLFEYRCVCGHIFETLRSSSDLTNPPCPECGGTTEKIISSFSVGRQVPETGCKMGDLPGSGCSGCRYAGHGH